MMFMINRAMNMTRCQLLSGILMLVFSVFAHGFEISNVFSFFQSKDALEWESQTGITIKQTVLKTRIADDNGFEWMLPFPFRVDGAVELKSGSELILLIVQMKGDGYEYAFMIKFEKRIEGWRVVAPLHDQQVLMQGEEWIDSISIPLAEPEALIVRFAKLSELSGGGRDVVREWRYWDFETGQLGDVFRGEVQPSKFIE